MTKPTNADIRLLIWHNKEQKRELNCHSDKLDFGVLNGGLHWRFKNKMGDSISVICHMGSYGHETGLFEVGASWESDVKGYLDFKAVSKYIDILNKRDIQKSKSNTKFAKKGFSK